jgi:DNA-binding NarL/FixJ family response regulator
MSMDDGTIYAERAIKAGARGYIAKEEASDSIITAIKSVMGGKMYLSNEIANNIAMKHIYGNSNRRDREQIDTP